MYENMEIRKYMQEQLPFWSGLTVAEQDIVVGGSTQIHYDKGSRIYQGQDCRGIMLIVSGQLRTYIVSDEGREVTLFRARGGESCVMSAACLLDAIAFDVLIEAIEDTEVLMISSSSLASILQDHPRAEVYIYKTATERFSEAMWMMQQILFMGADKRVAIFLWEEYCAKGNLEISFTHDEIARLIGSAREVVTKILRYFVQEEVITTSRGKITIVNKEKLRSFCD